MNSFAFSDLQSNLRQRVGYFGAENGIYFEANGTELAFVLRSKTSGSVNDTRRYVQSTWDGDTFDGHGASGVILDPTKTNIFWMDVEWLGVGDVRCGFVVDGKPLPAHIFHNDNVQTEPYMTTACLPIRYEIRNTGVTTSNSRLKQICSTVVSEGGYALSGKQRSVS